MPQSSLRPEAWSLGPGMLLLELEVLAERGAAFALR